MKLKTNVLFKIQNRVKLEENLKKNGLNLFYSLIIALFVVIVLSLSNKNFFFFDEFCTNLLW